MLISILFQDHLIFIFKKAHKRKLSVEKLNDTVDKIVHLVANQASKHQKVKEDVSLSIQNAIKDLLAADLQPDEESGFSFVEYEPLEMYQGPTKLIDFIEEEIVEDEVFEDDESAAAGNTRLAKPGQTRKVKTKIDDSTKHGEIIIIVHQGQKVNVRADDDNDTVISNIIHGELIIRNVDTNLILNISKGEFNNSVELNIVGQAYIKDLSGTIKVKQFKGIVVIKNEDHQNLKAKKNKSIIFYFLKLSIFFE